ncbi:MAG TPA: type 1 glutamine amidotransferase domain-containing protein [Stellaceae bacterium]|jgi:protease I|nr:type 1 glutamine amidotransferase domain-containing protein [Stellaceae bacterium]
MVGSLRGKRIAMAATDGFEQSELLEPRKALEAEGAKVEVIAPKSGEIQGMEHHDKGKKVRVDHTVDEVKPEDYAALVLPGGVANPDALRAIPKVVGFVKTFFDQQKPVAAICHGPWTLVEADVVKGVTVTSWPPLKTDLKNAGANWVDREVVREGNFVTSRKPDDLPAFCREMIDLFKKAA